MSIQKFFNALMLTALGATVFIALVAAISSISNASSFDDKDSQTVYFKAGDTVILPNRKGNFIMLLWGGEPIWYNPTTEWFQHEPIRNYSTAYLDITRMIPEGDYQFVEIDAIGDDPYNVRSWKWLRDFKLHVNKCDGFKLC